MSDKPQNTRNAQKKLPDFMGKLLDGAEVEWKALGEVVKIKHGKD